MNIHTLFPQRSCDRIPSSWRERKPNIIDAFEYLSNGSHCTDALQSNSINDNSHVEFFSCVSSFIWINETTDKIVGISTTGEKCMYVRDQVIGAEQ